MARPARPTLIDQAPRAGGRSRKATGAPTVRARVVRRHASSVRSGWSPGSNSCPLIAAGCWPQGERRRSRCHGEGQRDLRARQWCRFSESTFNRCLGQPGQRGTVNLRGCKIIDAIKRKAGCRGNASASRATPAAIKARAVLIQAKKVRSLASVKRGRFRFQRRGEGSALCSWLHHSSSWWFSFFVARPVVATGVPRTEPTHTRHPEKGCVRRRLHCLFGSDLRVGLLQAGPAGADHGGDGQGSHQEFYAH